jgi:hypothetical protein
MAGYTKLSSSIVNSSIWDEPDTTRIVWVTMLALADKDGIVHASIGGLAHASRVSKEAAIAAIETLSDPDPESRHSAEEGRRIKRIEGGWHLINHHLYRQLGLIEAKREAWAETKKKQRQSDKCPGHVPDCPGHTGLGMGCVVSAPEGESEGKPLVNPSKLALEAHSAFPNPPKFPAAEAVGNAAELMAQGYTPEQIRKVVAWVAKGGDYKPRSAAAVLDPSRFQTWLTECDKSTKRKEPMIAK